MVKTTNLKKFEAQWEAQLQRIEDEIIIPLQARFAELLLVNLQQVSPKYSGYYASNHRIVLEGNNFKLNPPQRRANEERGVYLGNIAASRTEEVSKLQDRQALKGVVNIKVGTAVPYAVKGNSTLYLERSVEATYQVYARAQRITLAQYKVEVTGRT